MASRFWVGTGSWTAVNTTNWSATSGGSGGASVPTAADDVRFNASSGNCTVGSGYTPQCVAALFNGYASQFDGNGRVVQIYATATTIFDGGSGTTYTNATFEISGSGSGGSSRNVVGSSSASAPSLNVTGTGPYTFSIYGSFQNLNFTGSNCIISVPSALSILGNLTLSTGNAYMGVVFPFVMSGSGSKTITSNGATLGAQLSITTTGSVTLADNFSNSGNTLFLNSGTFNANNFNVTTTTFSSSNSSPRTVTMGSGTWTLVGEGATAVWDVTSPTNLTVNANTATITATSATSKTFNGGGMTYYNLNQGGAGSLTINGANTFNNITNSVQPATIIFPASATTTVSNFGLSGTLNNVITLQSSSAGTRFTISKSSGTVTPQYLSIKDSAATGGATWIAQNSTNAGNNTGWSIIPAAGFLMFI
jgi:hypothetical protein